MTNTFRLSVLTTATIAAAAISGCASTARRIDVPIDAGHATYTLPAAIFASATPQELAQRYREGLAASSHYGRAMAANDVLAGLEFRTSASVVSVAYVRKSTTSQLRNDFIADFGLTVTQRGENIVLDVACPSLLHIDADEGPLPLPWKPFVPQEQAAADVRSMCAAAVVTGTRTESGEVNVSFPDSSVYSNFSRKLQPAPQAWRDATRVSKDDLVKFKWFVFQDGQARRVVGISVYPYRSGSKVTYRWEHSVGCRPNTPCQFDQNAAQRMQDLVASIAND